MKPSFNFSLLCPAVAGEGERVTFVPGIWPVSNHDKSLPGSLDGTAECFNIQK